MIVKSVNQVRDHHSVSSGGLYVVYFMHMVEGSPLRISVGPDFPHVYDDHPLSQFMLVDGRLSRHWIVHRINTGVELKQHLYLWGYPEYAQDNNYRLALVNGERWAIEVFERYREFLELEFPLPNVESRATLIADGWYQCPKCQEAWECYSKDGMVRCMACRALHHNPVYQP